jgi:hypothetical protein
MDKTVFQNIRLPESLRRAAREKARQLGLGVGAYIRRLIAADTGSEEPDMPTGNAALSPERRKKITADAAAARWEKPKKRGKTRPKK